MKKLWLLYFREGANEMTFKPWMLNAAYDVASVLPVKPDEALSVLALVKQLVLKNNKPYVERLRALRGRNGLSRSPASSSDGGGLAGVGLSTRSGAARKASTALARPKRSKPPK